MYRMQPLGTAFCYLVKGDSALGPAFVLDIVAEKCKCAVGALCLSWKAHSWTVNDREKLKQCSSAGEWMRK